MTVLSGSYLDLSRLPPPDAIEPLSFREIFEESIAELKVALQAEGIDWDVDQLETDPLVVTEEVRSARELRLRARINQAVRSVLAPLAKGADLDNVVARQGIGRIVLRPANPATAEPAVMESDASLLRRYMLSFERPSAGSRNRYKLEALTAFPEAGDVAVAGRADHGRIGDTDVITSGPGGRDATDAEMVAVKAAVLDHSVVPEAVSVAVLRAVRVPYVISLVIEVPEGPDPDLIAENVRSIVLAEVAARTRIGGEIPLGFIPGVAYTTNVIRVVDMAPVQIEPDPYKVPVCVSITIKPEVRR